MAEVKGYAQVTVSPKGVRALMSLAHNVVRLHDSPMGTANELPGLISEARDAIAIAVAETQVRPAPIEHGPFAVMAGAPWNVLDSRGVRIALCGGDSHADWERFGQPIAEAVVAALNGGGIAQEANERLVKELVKRDDRIAELEKQLSLASEAANEAECQLEDSIPDGLLPKEAIDAARQCLARIVCTTPPDDGVVLLSNEGPCHYDAEQKCQVYDHEHFSPLGDALMELHRHLISVDAAIEQQIERTYGAKAHVTELLNVMHWAQSVLTALNVGNVAKDSPLHKKLREVLIGYRDKREAAADKQSYDDLAASDGIVDAP